MFNKSVLLNNVFLFKLKSILLKYIDWFGVFLGLEVTLYTNVLFNPLSKSSVGVVRLKFVLVAPVLSVCVV
jgi:hypothetical protein